MAMLKNTKHESFAQLISGGMAATESYVRAGYNRKGAAQNAGRLIKNEQVAARILELRSVVVAKAIDLTSINEAYVIAGIVEMTERCMQHRPVMQDGKPVMVELEKGKVAAAYRFDAQGAARGFHLLGLRLNMFGNGPRLPPGMNKPFGEEAAEGGNVTNNTLNVINIDPGKLREINSAIDAFCGFSEVAKRRQSTALRSPD